MPSSPDCLRITFARRDAQGGDLESAVLNAAKTKTDEIKKSAYAFGKALENLTKKQQNRVAMIAENNNRLYRAYRMNEILRLLMKKQKNSGKSALFRYNDTEESAFFQSEVFYET